MCIRDRTNAVNPEIGIEVKENEVIVTRPSDDPVHRSLHGLTRTLVSNMVTGCHETVKKELEVNGVGYRVAKQGKNLVMNLGCLLYTSPRRRIVRLNRFISDLAKTECFGGGNLVLQAARSGLDQLDFDVSHNPPTS